MRVFVMSTQKKKFSGRIKKNIHNFWLKKVVLSEAKIISWFHYQNIPRKSESSA